MHSSIRFGIPQLDQILAVQDFHAEEKTGEEWVATSATILGPDGTGKSVFSLHIASTYISDSIRKLIARGSRGARWWENPPERQPPTAGQVQQYIDTSLQQHFSSGSKAQHDLPKVLYVSTDLRYGRAREVWENFWLDVPWNRHLPFDFKSSIDFKRKHLECPIHVSLQCLKPHEIAALETFLRPGCNGPAPAERKFGVGFLDLASNTAGDDWDLILRTVSGVRRGKHAPPNLLIVDSVAGFETLAGDWNAYGQAISRRTRLAQLIRAAGEAWSLVLVVEEPKPGEHSPEEFVTDMVLRLRREGIGEHARRTLEVEKARTSSHGLGEHAFEIRDGEGTSTGGWQNADDPRAAIHSSVRKHVADKFKPEVADARTPVNSYVQVFQSLHFRSHEFSKRTNVGGGKGPGTQTKPQVGFGIPYLDNLLSDQGRPDELGLPAGTVTALIGDESTRKSLLAQTFIRNGYRCLPQIVCAVGALADELIRTPLEEAAVEGIVEKWSQSEHGRNIPESSCPNSASLAGLFLKHWNAVRERYQGIGAWFARVCRGELVLAAQPGENAPGASAGTKRPLAAREAPGYYVASPPSPPSGEERWLAVICTILREIPGILTPTVLITTDDIDSESIAREVLELLAADIQRELTERRVVWNTARPHFSRVLERVLLVRRLELHDTTTAQIFHMIEENILTSLDVLSHGEVDRCEVVPRPEAGNVRVVIGDMRLLRSTFPDLAQDKLFLPTLVMRLGRWGVTSIIVDTGEGRPDRGPGSPHNGELRSLVSGQLYTWRVPFFGENRVAIATIPPMIPGGAGIVRELEVERRESPGQPLQLRVNPHFELYSGIEEGSPEAVRLQVLLYEETKAFADYVSTQNALFSRLFASQQGFGGQVIEVRGTKDYDGLRDFCQLPSETRLPYTLVFVVDGYWGLSKPGALRKQGGALRNQEEYLHRPIRLGERTSEAFQEEYANYVDVLQLYRETQFPGDFTETFRKYLIERGYPDPETYGKPLAEGQTCRWLYYRQARPAQSEVPPDARETSTAKRTPYYYLPRFWKPQGHDRVPFTWDFGFLLCSRREWKNASQLILRNRVDTKTLFSRWLPNQPEQAATGAPPNTDFEATVGDVWDALPKVDFAEGPNARHSVDLSLKCGLAFIAQSHPKSPELRSWRYFFDAAQQVALVEERRTGKKGVPFDLAMMAPDSLSCLLLEIWASEIVRTDLRLRRIRPMLSEATKSVVDDRLEESERILAHFSTVRFNPEEYADISQWLCPLKYQAKHRFPKTAEEAFRLASDARTESFDHCALNLLKFPGFTLELYKVWLLLLEVLPVESYSDPTEPFQLKMDRPPQTNAVAARHWYKTACLACEADENQDGNEATTTRVPMRLPGFFSVRGDWYLAVAKGSRSNRLADLALDMLTSRKANRARLQTGVGLPTRDVIEGENAACLRTRLTVSTQDRVSNVLYGDLADLGGDYIHPATDPASIHLHDDQFRWFFRSAFVDYDRQAAAFRKWVARILQWTRQYRHDNRETWRGGFQAYDELDWGCFTSSRDYVSFQAFATYMDRLAEDLQQCSLEKQRISHDHSGPPA